MKNPYRPEDLDKLVTTATNLMLQVEAASQRILHAMGDGQHLSPLLLVNVRLKAEDALHLLDQLDALLPPSPNPQLFPDPAA